MNKVVEIHKVAETDMEFGRVVEIHMVAGMDKVLPQQQVLVHLQVFVLEQAQFLLLVL